MRHLHFDKRIKLAIAVFLSLVVLAIVLTAALYISRIGKVAIVTKYAPFNASVYLNGSRINNNATNFLTPGEYELTASLDNFITFTETIIITEETEYILGALIPANEEGQEVANRRRRDFLEVEGIFGNMLHNAGNQIRQEYPILDFLPINNSFYSISFAYKDDGSPKITVVVEPEMADIAVRKLLAMPNITLIDYDISFTTPNPFTQPTSNTATNPIDFIKASFPNIIDDHRISTGKTIDNYYITTIYTYNFASHDSFAHFKVILRRNNNAWTFATTPQLLFTTTNAPSIPANILNQANQL
jgi:hypothetical protein